MTATIKKQILEVQKTGEANMFDVSAVQHIANREGFYELVIYIEEHRSGYVQFILTGHTER